MTRPLHQPVPVNEEQHAIIRHLMEAPLTVVSAGAGAGKTYTTVAAVIELIGIRRACADEFVLITFTNQAADHLRQELHKAITAQIDFAQDDAERCMHWFEQRERLCAAFIGTIHALCKQMLMVYGYGAGVSREASVSFASRLRNEAIERALEQWLADDTVPGPLVEIVRSGAYPEYELRKLLGRILDEVRSQGLGARRLCQATESRPDDRGKPERVTLARLVADIDRRYQEACRQAQQLDASALLDKARELLHTETGDHVARSLAMRFRYLFIDEFQDTTETQAAIVEVLAQHMTVMVVGDRKQSIYAFAGANVALLERFAETHGTRCLPLRLSGRPTHPLLGVQNALFRSMRTHFPELDEPLLASDRNHRPQDELPPVAIILEPAHEPSAVRDITTRIKNLIGREMDRPSEGRRPIACRDIAVLVRSNSEVDAWVARLNEAGMPARSDAGISFLRQPEIIAMYRFLQLLLRYPDDVALVESLSTPHFADIDLNAREAELLTYGVVRGRPLTDEYERAYPHHAQKVRTLHRQSRTATVPQLLGLIEQTFSLKEHYRGQGRDDAAVGLDRLRDYVRHRFSSDQALTLRTFVDMLHRDILNNEETRDTTCSEDGDSTGQIAVMTIHRSKGLEFPVIIMPGIEKDRRTSRAPDFIVDAELGLELNVAQLGMEPSSAFLSQWDAAQQRLLAEEMRLFYVGMTRAKHMVCLFGVDPVQLPGTRELASWQHQVLSAKEAMRACGARFKVAGGN